MTNIRCFSEKMVLVYSPTDMCSFPVVVVWQERVCLLLVWFAFVPCERVGAIKRCRRVFHTPFESKIYVFGYEVIHITQTLIHASATYTVMLVRPSFEVKRGTW